MKSFFDLKKKKFNFYIIVQHISKDFHHACSNITDYLVVIYVEKYNWT